MPNGRLKGQRRSGAAAREDADPATGSARWSEPTHCDRYKRCSAPICPLDADWQQRKMHKRNRVCFYLGEAVKRGAQARFGGAGRSDMYERCTTFAEEASARCAPLRKGLERAQTTGPRLGRQVGAQRDARRMDEADKDSGEQE
jgi:hypothetical protein